MSIVSIQRTKSDEYAGIKAAVDKVIEQIGGLDDIISEGAKVVIKPNLVAKPASRLSGAVTRWEVCLAVCEAVKAAGGIPIIAESSAAGADTEAVIQMCEYQKLRDMGIPVLDLKKEPACDIQVNNGTKIDRLKSWEVIRDADAIITVPVMKTHDQTEITLGMKNCKGLITDVQKKNFHSIGVVESVCDLVETIKPVLEIVDGTYGQQGLGPIFGETKQMNLILGSKDLVACETVTGLIMGYDPEKVMITATAAARGLGEMDIEKIQVVGETIEAVRSPFKRPGEVEIEGLPESFHLIFDAQACTGCHNTVISSLMDMKAQDLLGYLEGMNVVVGPCTKDQLPEDATGDNTVCVGICAKKLAEEIGARCAIGCPPGNVDTVKAILGDRREYGVRY
ncbi:MAG: DUF362 domain-containing protein [Firmicutes bacterium]|nr:DUF362 domain-containing protein [Bacillota bacterium]